MKIGAISTTNIPSTTANSIQVMKVCQALAELGHTVRLYVPGNRGVTWSELEELYGLSQRFEIEWAPANPLFRRNDFAWAAVRRAVRWRAQLIYSWAIQSAAMSVWLGMPALYEAHDLPTGRLGPQWMRAFLQSKTKKRMVIITRALRQALEARFGRLVSALPKGQAFVAPNGVDLAKYQDLPEPAQAREQLGLARGLTVGCTGHLYAGRGGGLFLELAARFPRAQFVWVGGREEDVASMRQKAEQAGLDNLRFTGFVPNTRVPLYQAAADVLLMPYERKIAGSSGGNSAEIASPMKLFDYLGAGRAILTSDLPVIREVLDEHNAVFAPPEDADAWAAALERLLSDDALRARLASKARGLAVQYSWMERERKCLQGL